VLFFELFFPFDALPEKGKYPLENFFSAVIEPDFFPLIIAISSFFFVLSAIIFEWIDKALAATLGAFFLILCGILRPEEIADLIDFRTIFLLLGMMILVEVVRESKLLSWMNIQIIEKTRGNPLFLFLFFAGTTFFLSTFLANATTMMVLVPITIAITRGMGLDPKPYLISEILFSDIGGALTLVGDPTNVIIGSANHFSFLDFLRYNSIPVFAVSIVVLGILAWKNWEIVRPVQGNIPKMFLTHLLIEKIRRQFATESFQKSFALLSAVILGITVCAFVFDFFHLPIELLALLAASIALLVSRPFVQTHEILHRVDWHLLIFFAGLFLQVGALEKVGALHPVSIFIASHADSVFELSMFVLWGIGLLSAFIENIPLVAMMIPVLQPILANGTISGNHSFVWFALSLGACLGGNGSLIGSSANMVVAQVADRAGIRISFWEYFKIGYPLTIISLLISSVFLFFATR